MFIKNLKIRKKSKKLDYIKLELFFIQVKKGTISYKLKLLKDAKVYLIFYILLLELLNPKMLIYNIFHYQVQKENKIKVKKFLY